MVRPVIPAWLLLAAIAVAGCTHRPRQAEPDGAYVQYADDQDASVAQSEAAADVNPFMAAEAQPRAKRMEKAFMPAPMKPSGGYSSAEPASPYPNAPQARPAPDKVPSKRMVHYSGSATLRSTEPERILDSAIAIVTGTGGYLEGRSPGFASLRVPSGDFDSLFARLLRLAEVMDYRQQAEDITEAVQDTDLRLKVVAATLERLEDLIKKARTESQKLRLLRELKRFREEREVLEARKRDLVQRARFASIQLSVLTHAPLASGGAYGRDLADFQWILRLNPFDDRRFRGRSRVKFQAPEGMVRTGKRSPWRATSSQGSEFWGSEVEVDLLGDSRFWRDAVRSRMESGFKAADTARAGGFLFCRFQSFGPAPYYYWVGVRSRGDELDLAEFYFPNGEQQDRLLPGLLAAVERKPL